MTVGSERRPTWFGLPWPPNLTQSNSQFSTQNRKERTTFCALPFTDFLFNWESVTPCYRTSLPETERKFLRSHPPLPPKRSRYLGMSGSIEIKHIAQKCLETTFHSRQMGSFQPGVGMGGSHCKTSRGDVHVLAGLSKLSWFQEFRLR